MKNISGSRDEVRGKIREEVGPASLRIAADQENVGGKELMEDKDKN
jgi:hypothetical protein